MSERKPTQDDVEAAQRGLNMLGMSIAELRDLVAEFKGKEAFASKVIVIGAKQMIAAKRRAGARENPRGRNPSQRIRATRSKGYVSGVWRFRGRERRSEARYPYNMAGTGGFYQVQVRRGKRWIALATFPKDSLTGRLGKARAVEYGRLLARRYPRQVFRVSWPDGNTRKNPTNGTRFKVVAWHGEGNSIFRVVDTKTGRTKGETSLRRDGGGARELADIQARALNKAGASFAPPVKPAFRRKNPAPRASRGGAEAEPKASQVGAAARLFSQFTGHTVRGGRRVNLPAHAAGLAIGPVLSVAYETTRDGKREKYLHDFRRQARPTLAASHDGRQLYLLGGAYRFTERGIVDKP